MDMHGMLFEFPPTFSARNSAGIEPLCSHLRYIPDFCGWNGRLVLATDETSIQGNKLAGQPQSNLWFGHYEDLRTWGPASGYGGPWVEDDVTADTPSDPFLIAGFARRVLHLAVGRKRSQPVSALRATDQQPIKALPPELADLARVTIHRGDWHEPAAGFEFDVDRPVNVYLAVDRRGEPELPAVWRLTPHSLEWGKGFVDDVYVREFVSGTVAIPGNPSEHSRGSFGMPHMAFVEARDGDPVRVTARGRASVTWPVTRPEGDNSGLSPVEFSVQVDRSGNGQWIEAGSVTVPANGSVCHYLPESLNAVWLRLKVDRDCVATAFLHQTAATFIDGRDAVHADLFAGLADVADAEARGGLIYPARRNRNLRVITAEGEHLEFTKATFEFQAVESDDELSKLLRVDPDFTVDEASVVLRSAGQTYRLPKGHAAYDRPFVSGWPRSSREVESERHLANIHGTFYEVPLILNGSPPAWNRMRPVSSHSKQITDFCSWNGLLVLAGVGVGAANDGHVFADPDGQAALWFGGIDDLWKMGKPAGVGGPWLRSAVRAGVPSDPYLMTGYDRKSVRLSHESRVPVTLTLQVDIEGSGLWVDYREFPIAANEIVEHEFPKAYSACWVRAVSDQDTTATAIFEYR